MPGRSGRACSVLSRWCLRLSIFSAASWSPSACCPCTRRRNKERASVNANLAAVLYLVAGVLFILALRGLSSPTSSRRGNLFGMVGMAIAIVTTLAAHPPADLAAWALVVVGLALGGGTGAGGRVPFAGRHGGGSGPSRRPLCAERVRYRRGRRDSSRQPGRNVARRRHRRRHL